jgi:hypothetical protein
MKIRIHHFFDSLRDFGSGKNITPHPYGHSYHLVAEQIRNNPDLEIELVVEADQVCIGCSHLVNGVCDDTVTHRADFRWKEDFNNYLDKRIINVCRIDISKKYSVRSLIRFSKKYIENIEFIYEGNDPEHTHNRKKNVIRGLKYYSGNHGITIQMGL